MSIERPRAPYQPTPNSFKIVRRFEVDFHLIKISLIFFIIGCASFLIGRASGPNVGIFGIILVPFTILGIWSLPLFYSSFSFEHKGVYVKKKKSDLVKEQIQYQKDLKIYNQKLIIYQKAITDKIKLDEADLRDKLRREKKATQNIISDKLKNKLDETDVRDKLRREKESKKQKDQLSSKPKRPSRSLKELLEELQFSKSENELTNTRNTKLNQSIVNHFEIESTNLNTYKWYALWSYFPTNRFPAHTLQFIDVQHRKLVFDFKDGLNPEKFAKILSEAMVQKFGKNTLNNKTLLIVPASTKQKTELRFKLFCKKLSEYTSMINGFDYLVNNGIQRIPVHLGGNRNQGILSSIKLNYLVKGKDLIIVDDVRTSGKSSNDIQQYLIKKGAKSTIFIYFGRTVASNS